ncbi:attractin-like protein 1 isoform X2 [Cylas formicarius]|uniref:attractin-like protein 1 isoform X2 n=1 Tax=Cylas formicarius TaxID=197179 RepID=UPI00295873DB|nr:attractin-like protein 1 isoform X2 [Cylas formicarius]
MLEVLQMFLFLFKSKYRRKQLFWQLLCSLLVLMCVSQFVSSKCIDDPVVCGGNGVCKNDTCVCYDGWQGPSCQFCGGKVRLGTSRGTIHDGPGNYSLTSKCSWLIDAPNATITLHIEEFATECGWDHLYVFDGDSVNSPLLAVFSGLMYTDEYRVKKIPEVVAQSGSALVHFFSDDAYNMSGFNITYRLNACPSVISGIDCSGNGICIDGVCTCDGRWDGIACHLRKCPDDCGASQNRGICEPERGCHCFGEYKGDDCSQLASRGYWEIVSVQGFIPPGSASHGATVWKDSMYIIAGESYNRGSLMYIYDFNGNVWETPHVKEGPSIRYGHSTVIYGDKIFLYGGVMGNRGPTSELWAFDISAKIWENITVKAESCNGSFLMCGPLKSAGHTATIVNNNTNKKADKMVIIFGHSPHLGYLNTVQEYYFGTREWHIVNTSGYPVKGGYGHTASWDALTEKIYVYGGVISESESAQLLSKSLYSYEPDDRVWTLLADAPSARFLHTASFISGGLMLVFGGNTHNDTSHSFGAKCYSAELLAYDVLCDTWTVMSIRKDLHADLARFGHSGVVFEGSFYIYGGFDGQMLSDMLKYTPGNCQSFNTSSSCLTTRPGVKCVWDIKNLRCWAVMSFPKEVLKEDSPLTRCPEKNRSSIQQAIVSNTEKCQRMEDCLSCAHTTAECVWCGSACVHHKRCRAGSNVNNNNATDTALMTYARGDLCPPDPRPICRQLHTCTACTYQPFCRWRYEHAKCVTSQPNSTAEANEPAQCQKVCSEYTSCKNCTQEECIWCQNEGRCVDKNAYTSSFPYGQCREWTTIGSKCRTRDSDENSQCSFYKTCTKCRDDPACGWCDDGSKTGLGECIPGGDTGPTLHTQSLPSSTCPEGRWHFTSCPLCQCNGHASCLANTSQCDTCQDLTTGSHCEQCRTGYWGSPVNGGKCQKCDCRGHADDCQRETGKCLCRTKGLTGDQCEKCDINNHYHPDHYNNGTCYYDLTIDYQFTFNLSKKEDKHYTQINFRNSPIKADIDVDFSVTCSKLAKMNITIRRYNSLEEKPIFTVHNCTNNFRYRFGKSEYNFGVEDNMTLSMFYVYVYDFESPLLIQISFSQYPKLNLQQFFITFSSCFLLLLLVAAVLWKIKQRYDMYRRRQRLFVEMEQMASRPFSQVLVEIEVKRQAEIVAEPMTVEKRKKRDAPSPIALEPCAGSRAAVLSLLIRLPTGGEPYTVKGQSAGLAIASALVTLGNPRKLSVDQMKTETKTGKSRKSQSQHPDG